MKYLFAERVFIALRIGGRLSLSTETKEAVLLLFLCVHIQIRPRQQDRSAAACA
jgi:hypothetical protein